MNKDAIINQLERIYANLVALGTHYFQEHCAHSSNYAGSDGIDAVEFGLWDAELRIKEIIKLLEESHEFRDTRNSNDKESWETSEWSYDAGMAMAFQDCGTEKTNSKVSQEDGEAAAQEAIRRY